MSRSVSLSTNFSGRRLGCRQGREAHHSLSCARVAGRIEGTLALAAAWVVFLIVLVAPAGAHVHKESWYSDALAAEISGRTEARMPNGTRCDVLTATHAIEVEFAAKWCESLGQALNYAAQTGRAAGIALIIETSAEERFLARLREVIRYHRLPVAVCVLRPAGPASLQVQSPFRNGPDGGRK